MFKASFRTQCMKRACALQSTQLSSKLNIGQLREDILAKCHNVLTKLK